MPIEHQLRAGGGPRPLRWRLTILAAAIASAVTSAGSPTAAHAHTYLTPDMSCMEVQYEFAGPVRPTRCQSMTVAVVRPHSDRPKRYAAHLRNASWKSWTHAKAVGRGQVQTHQQGWVDIRIQLSRPRRETYNLVPKRHRWTYTQFRFKYVAGRPTGWLKYQWAECDSFSSVYC